MRPVWTSVHTSRRCHSRATADLTVLFWNYLINLPMESEEGDLLSLPTLMPGVTINTVRKACGVHAASIAALRMYGNALSAETKCAF